MNFMFLIALLKKDNSVVDIGWGMGFVVLTAFLFNSTAAFNADSRKIAILIMVTLWGLRLASYIFVRNFGKGEDYRYRQWRTDWGKNVIWRSYLQVFMLQGAILFLVSLPISMVMLNSQIVGCLDNSNELGFLNYSGIALFAVGLIIESHADWHLYWFKLKPESKGRIMKYGFWSITRHPNYFGEALLWWGIFVFAIPSGYWYISVISPVLITFLLVRVSGVALLEKKYAGNPEYQEYIKNTAAFIPWVK